MSATFYVSTHTAECSIHTCYHFDYQYVPDDLIASLVGGVDLSEKGEVYTSHVIPSDHTTDKDID